MSKIQQAMDFLYELRDYIDGRVAGEQDEGQRQLSRLGSRLLDLVDVPRGPETYAPEFSLTAPPEPYEPPTLTPIGQVPISEPAPSQPPGLERDRRVPEPTFANPDPFWVPCPHLDGPGPCYPCWKARKAQNTEPGHSPPEPGPHNTAPIWLPGDKHKT